MSNEILNGFNAIKELTKGASTLANAVKITLGPKGKNVVLERKYSTPLVTNDGVTIAKEINLSNSFQNMGANLIKEASIKTNDIAGDGTTTACILTESILQEGLKACSVGINPVEIKNGINIAKDYVVETLNKISIPISSNKEIYQIATISAGSSIIGKLISEAFNKVGKNGVISVEEGKSFTTNLKIVDGMQFNNGYLSPYMANNNSLTCELNDCYILTFESKINNINQIINVLNYIIKEQKSLLIICNDIESEVLATLVLNKIKGILNIAVVKSPSFADRRTAIMQDIAILSGSTLINEMNNNTKNVEISMLGNAEKVKVTKDSCIIKNGYGNKDELKNRIILIDEQIKNATNNFDKTSLEERKAKLTGGIAVIEVGSATDCEMQEQKLRIEDAISATKSAVQEGIVPGGGVALITAYKLLKKHIKTLKENEKIGAKIVLSSLLSPIKQIAENAGVSSGVIINKILNSKNKNFGYNANTNKFCNMIECGIIDPTKVTKTAILSACSVASTMLTTGCAIINENKDDNK